jgi:methylmalonyl-CoA mutase N-terminal domain/subunit
LTNQVETSVYEYFQKVKDLGGVIPAIEKGFFQSEIADASYQYQKEIDSGDRKIVAVNAYEDQKPIAIPILEMDPDGYSRQVNRLNELRANRDSGRVGSTLDRLRIACQGTENTMPYILDAVHAYATLGEIISVMKDVFGTYQEPTWV